MGALGLWDPPPRHLHPHSWFPEPRNPVGVPHTAPPSPLLSVDEHQLALMSWTLATRIGVEGRPTSSDADRYPTSFMTVQSLMHRTLRLDCVAATLLGLLASSLSAAEPVTFEKHVRPILKAHCFLCHGEAGGTQGKLDLRLKRWLVRGGESGAAIDPGHPSDSYLLNRVELGEMPPGEKKLSPTEIDVIRRWIAAGATTARPEPQTIQGNEYISEEDRSYWAFQRVVRPKVPQVQNLHQVHTPIDAFLLKRLEGKRLAMSELADRAVLIRRVTFDLTGLPPTPEAVREFIEDRRGGAWQRLVQRLLASPGYGERWGRHWLDSAGYADSEGYSDDDRVRPSAFRFRDYVVRSFNSDRPFDEFIVQQLAGDELVPPPGLTLAAAQIEALSATGYLRMAPDGTGSGGVDAMVARNEVVADTIRIVSTSLLGLTVGCARCHDHRYDPISQADYYRMRAIFEPALDPPPRAGRLPTAASCRCTPMPIVSGRR